MDIQLKDLALAVFGVLLGIPVAHYYFRRTIKRRLAVYLLYQWTTDDDLRDAIRECGSSEYRLSSTTGEHNERVVKSVRSGLRQKMYHCLDGVSVDQLVEAEFLVVNESDSAITAIVNPLTLRCPQGLKPLETTITLRQSEAISVSCHVHSESDFLTVDFPFLNSSEWFVVRVLADGNIAPQQWRWTIGASDIPRTLTHAHFTLQSGERAVPKTVWQLVMGALAPFLFLGLALLLMYVGALADAESSILAGAAGVAGAVSILASLTLLLTLPTRYKKWQRSSNLVQSTYRAVWKTRDSAHFEAVTGLRDTGRFGYFVNDLLPYDAD